MGLFQKKEVSLIFIITDPFQCYLSLSVWCICVCVGVCVCVCMCVCALFIYIISVTIICVSQEENSLIASYQQIYHFLQANNF